MGTRNRSRNRSDCSTTIWSNALPLTSHLLEMQGSENRSLKPWLYMGEHLCSFFTMTLSEVFSMEHLQTSTLITVSNLCFQLYSTRHWTVSTLYWSPCLTSSLTKQQLLSKRISQSRSLSALQRNLITKPITCQQLLRWDICRSLSSHLKSPIFCRSVHYYTPIHDSLLTYLMLGNEGSRHSDCIQQCWLHSHRVLRSHITW